MLGDGLIAEEVFTVQAATEFLQKTKHIVNTVDHREAQKVLLPIKRGWKSETGTPLETTAPRGHSCSHIRSLKFY